MAPGFVFCPAAAKWLSALPTGGSGYRLCRVGNADLSFSENSEKPKNPGAPIYGSRIRVLSGGSKWLRALPGRNPCGVPPRVFRKRRILRP